MQLQLQWGGGEKEGVMSFIHLLSLEPVFWNSKVQVILVTAKGLKF